MMPGTDGPEVMFGPRPRRRRWLAVAVIAGATAVFVLLQAQAPAVDPLTAVPAGSDTTVESAREHADDAPTNGGSGSSGAAAGPQDVPADLRGDDGPAADLPAPVGEVDGLVLRVPAKEFVVVGFHEASSASFAMEPIGRLLSNENSTRFDPVPDRAGTPYHILSSRGRIHPPTSALDVVMEDDEPVLAPVSGVIGDVREYDLYGRHLDHRVEIHPHDAPHLRVVVVHLGDVRVEEGDLVQAGVSVLAGTANRFPFTSQIDRETEPDRWPHVHLEVQPIDAPRPGDEPDEDEPDEDAPGQPAEGE